VFKLKKIERPIYARNVNGSFNKEGLIEHMVEVNIYYQGYRERTEIDVIEVSKIAEGGLNFYLPLSFLFYFLFHF